MVSKGSFKKLSLLGFQHQSTPYDKKAYYTSENSNQILH